MITPEQLVKSGTEHGHQAAIFCWANQNLDRYPQLKWLFAVPNGFYGSATQKGKMKVEGLKNGVPDIWLPVKSSIIITNIENRNTTYEYKSSSTKNYSGLIIELKVGKNKTSKEQDDWIEFLRSNEYKVEVCYGWEEAVKVIIEYLGQQ